MIIIYFLANVKEKIEPKAGFEPTTSSLEAKHSALEFLGLK